MEAIISPKLADISPNETLDTADRAAHKAYQAFRKRVLKESPPRIREQARNPFGGPGDCGRRSDIIRHFRKVLTDEFDRWWAEYPLATCRALGIPGFDGLFAPLFRRPRWLTSLMTSEEVNRRVKARTLPVRTLEGRQLLVRRATLRPQRTAWHTLYPEIDFVLRRITGKVDRNVERCAHVLGIERLRVAYFLGVRSTAELHRATEVLERVPHGFLSAWVDVGLLSRLSDLSELTVPREVAYRAGVEERRYSSDYRLLLRTLQAEGVSKDALRTLHKNAASYDFSPDQLDSVLRLMEERSVPFNDAVVHAGELLWTAAPRNWRFVFDEIGAHSILGALRFSDTLRWNGTSSRRLVRDLKRLGAGLGDLAAWQPWINEADYRHPAPTWAHLSALASSGLNLSQLTKCPAYVDERSALRFPRFVEAAARAGVVDGSGMVAVYPAFEAFDEMVTPSLFPLGGKLGSPPFDVWADFVAKFCRGRRNLKTLRYLMDAYDVRDLSGENRLLQLCKLHPSLLTYQHDIRRRVTWGQLAKWHYDHGWGAETIILREDRLPLQYAVLDEAERRDSYYAVAGILETIDVVLGEEATKRMTSVDLLVPILTSHLTEIFRIGEGMPQPSLVREAFESPPDFPSVRRRIDDARADIGEGGGPVVQNLTALELEVISFAYRLTEHDIRPMWSRVCGHEGDIDAFGGVSARHQDMRWQRLHDALRQAPSESQRRALSSIARWAKEWAAPPLSTSANADLFKHTGAGRSGAAEASIETIAGNLALLLACLPPDGERSAVLDRLEEAFKSPEQVDQDFSILSDFFYERLPAAVRNISPSAAIPSHLSVHVIRVFTHAGLSHPVLVTDVIPDAYDALRPTLDRWHKQLLKLRTTVTSGYTQLRASLTKHPAAFFSRSSTGLCTDADVGMWVESRHAHIVVFDPVSGTLAGMAMVYAQVIPEIDVRRTTLVLRAINLPMSLRSCYEPGSVVDAFLAMGRRLHIAGDHAALALPPDTSQHLLSNVPSLSAALTKRVCAPPFERLALKTPFYCYARGNDTAAVMYLYVEHAGQPAGSAQKEKTRQCESSATATLG